MKNKPAYALGSVDNVLLLLHLLRDQGRIKVSEAARELGIARSTAHRLLAMLVYRDFAVQDDNHNYLPGPSLSSSYVGGPPIRELRRIAQPHMEALCARVRETVNLAVRVGAEIRFLSSVESAQVLHVGDRRGTSLPAHQASGGKALLAELPEERLRELYAVAGDGAGEGPGEGGGAGRVPLTRAQWTRLRRDLAAARARGYTLNIEETEQGVSALGAALHNGRGFGVAALSVSVPSARFGGDRIESFIAELRRTVADIEPELADFPEA
ncbi:IclR family transcriptional regulator [Streptomonospora nanhaiensis]|uniref:DNA-binding IclR family transcriptional regulator n=1 Tax=Streptomonospora nanhaiensis TaxID=1323731 RepID=A0A853BWZ7_9ACTN|nr:IclR family transcriptional regulator [Streptomonospora nanhaiensis]MBV2365418.1 IclR family transcriptional regulator [Streptomonospora nanhaiensis]MBX9390836.1 IclR family transcriptional regulator [Streptomonospora nanhaiensis]NYI98987.1 DNA-binding IclR family transcriptional regulator [Streptomonospora nanhaiensis]